MRIVCDSVPDQPIFFYQYLSDHLPSFAPEDPGLPVIKRVLKKDTLRGIAAMHDQDVVHTGMLYIERSDTIDGRCRLTHSMYMQISNPIISLSSGGAWDVKEVRLADLEDSVHVPPGAAIVGRQKGNWMWRSPEAHAEGPVNKPSDLFSFGIVVSVIRPFLSLLT